MCSVWVWPAKVVVRVMRIVEGSSSEGLEVVVALGLGEEDEAEEGDSGSGAGGGFIPPLWFMLAQRASISTVTAPRSADGCCC